MTLYANLYDMAAASLYVSAISLVGLVVFTGFWLLVFACIGLLCMGALLLLEALLLTVEFACRTAGRLATYRLTWNAAGRPASGHACVRAREHGLPACDDPKHAPAIRAT